VNELGGIDRDQNFPYVCYLGSAVFQQQVPNNMSVFLVTSILCGIVVRVLFFKKINENSNKSAIA